MKLNCFYSSKVLALFTFLFLSFFYNNINSQVITPEEYFGFQPGSDYNLFNYEPLIEYLLKLDEASPKLKMVKIGETPLGKDMYIAFISSAENISNLEKLKSINKRLTFDFQIPDKEMKSIKEDGKVFFLATLSMHSGEVAPSQASPLIAFELITTDNPSINEWLGNVVYMMVPCHNPDGMDMIVDHYKKYKGTKYEGSSMPGVYHKYVGHDNNRDFVALTQDDTKAIARIYNLDWYPQVMVEKHQMGSTGPRYFVPPNHDPIAENVDAGIWNWMGIFGSNMIKDLTGAGLAGVSQHYVFDDYWPGSTETCIWKNVIGFLTEAASAKYATPIFVEPNELRVGGKGLSEYKKSINMPLPWEGGWWHLSDIVKLEIESTKSILKTASANKKEILQFRNDLCKREFERGKTSAPFYYILPRKQNDQSEFVDLVNLLMEQGISVYNLERDIKIQNTIYEKGSVVAPLAQAFRPFIKEVMERQKYPLRHYTPGGKIIKPYDITSWSLPLHKGVESIEINKISPEIEGALKKIESEYSIKFDIPDNYSALLLNAMFNESYKAAFGAMEKGLKVARTKNDIHVNGVIIPKGSFIIQNGNNLNELISSLTAPPVFLTSTTEIETYEISMPRIGLVETYFHDMDAGWTRFIFDSYKIPFKILHPEDFSSQDIEGEYDVIIFPNENKSILMEGKYKSGNDYFVTNYPPEYTKGIGQDGLDKITKFVNDGGIVLSWGSSTELFLGKLQVKLSDDETEEFQLPVRNQSGSLRTKGLYIPGSLVRLELLKDNPITLGMPDEIGVFYRGNPVFATSIPSLDMDRRVIGKFPEEKILLSGYSENEKLIGNKTGLVWLKKGMGQLVLFAFNPQFRASTNVSYKLLFNSMLLPKIAK